MNIVRLLLHVIAVTFVIWKSHSCYDMKDPIKYSVNKKNILERTIERKFSRILSSVENISNLNDEDCEVPYIRYIDDSDSEEDEPLSDEEDKKIIDYQFSEKVDKKYGLLFVDMRNKYIEFTELMDTKWRNKMWNEKWFKYLKTLYYDLHKYIVRSNLPISSRDCIFLRLLRLIQDDFKMFLNWVDAEWNKKLNQSKI
ncbi:hypothetical protein MKS88_005239 [Plasmodium brasilianum]|uniref:Plasmodium RESA N-terminal domain-containing protein n=2 Tax=Plasmodium (Plasmodium) TaxID=418103 RepID=A0A1A8X5I6_PLAMA|nr:Plasmodium exported protein, unknown function [Plasmodium malariae]KAI4834565.1 hypothetical protein MKS88_005239 [Plasmodium brasilianum]SBS99864.1 Plasmodium exported protein, unknown function [Plasmodium malariae]SCP03102.1 Plasmodium exported protein, unknown function [Plasmodium malariae]